LYLKYTFDIISLKAGQKVDMGKILNETTTRITTNEKDVGAKSDNEKADTQVTIATHGLFEKCDYGCSNIFAIPI